MAESLPAAPQPGVGTRSAQALRRKLAFSGLAQVMPLLANLVVTPYLIHTLGLDVFGIWALVVTALGTLTVLDGGVGASLTRFYAFSVARHDAAGAGQLLSGALLLFVVLGGVVGLIGFGLAPVVVHHLAIPNRLDHEAVVVLQLIGPLLILALASNAATSLLQASSRFGALATVMFAASAAYVLGVVFLVGRSHSLLVLVGVAAARYGVLVVGGLALGAREVVIRRPLLPARSVRREFGGYAMRMQLSGITMVVNGEVDALVIAAMLPVRFVGLYLAGYQAAAALRSVPLYAFPPVLTRMTGVFAEHGLPAAVAEFRSLQAQWLPSVLAYGVVATSAIGFGVQLWLGPGYGTSSLVAVVLMAGYTVHVAATGMRTCFVRSVGRPGLETRYSLVAMALNLALTIPFALLFGVIGVVAATAAGIFAGSLYFIGLCRRFADLHDQLPSIGWLGATTLAVALTIVGELFVRHLGQHGVLPLLLAGVPALLGLTLVAGQMMGGLRRTPLE